MDAFTLDWATFWGYAFPPFALIGRCLHQIQSQQVSHMVFVAPVWPAQPWYPLQAITIRPMHRLQFPLLLPVQEDLLTQGNRAHPLKHLQLAGRLLSAEVTKWQTFLHRVENSSWQPGGKTQLVPIPLPGQNGVAGVVNRSMSIPFHHLTNVLDFLALQFHEGKEYRTVNVYHSALSAVLPLIDGHKAGSHPLVCQLLKGVFQLRPSQPRYATMWQVSKVVRYISSLGSHSNLSTKLLSYKLVGLLALTAPDRASGLAACDLHFRYFRPEGVQFKLLELTKTARQGQDPKSCFHASFPDNEHLCVCKCLQEYEARTLQWRPQDPSKPNKLLLSHINPHKPVSPATLARWLKELMQLAGIDTTIFKGHSVHGAVAM